MVQSPLFCLQFMLTQSCAVCFFARTFFFFGPNFVVHESYRSCISMKYMIVTLSTFCASCNHVANAVCRAMFWNIEDGSHNLDPIIRHKILNRPDLIRSENYVTMFTNVGRSIGFCSFRNCLTICVVESPFLVPCCIPCRWVNICYHNVLCLKLSH